MVIDAPVVIDDRGDILIFESLEKATRYLEPIDVNNGECDIAFDSKGRSLRVYVVSNQVHIELTEDTSLYTEELWEMLSNFLVAVLKRKGLPYNWIAQASLEKLMKEGLHFKTE